MVKVCRREARGCESRESVWVAKRAYFFLRLGNFVLFGRVFFLLHDPVPCAARVGPFCDKITCDKQSPSPYFLPNRWDVGGSDLPLSGSTEPH